MNWKKLWRMNGPSMDPLFHWIYLSHCGQQAIRCKLFWGETVASKWLNTRRRPGEDCRLGHGVPGRVSLFSQFQSCLLCSSLCCYNWRWRVTYTDSLANCFLESFASGRHWWEFEGGKREDVIFSHTFDIIPCNGCRSSACGTHSKPAMAPSAAVAALVYWLLVSCSSSLLPGKPQLHLQSWDLATPFFFFPSSSRAGGVF